MTRQNCRVILTPKNLQKKVIIMESQQQKTANDMLEQGIQNYMGFGTIKPDFEAAYNLFKQGYKQTKDSEFAFWLAKCFQFGHGTQKNYFFANEMFKQALKNESNDVRSIAQYYISKNYRLERGVSSPDEHQFNKAVANIYLIKAAKNGYAQAQYEAGARSLFGIDMVQNKKLAIQLLTAAANPCAKKISATTLNIPGYAKAQELLGWCYKKGVGVAHIDTNKAVAYIHSAKAQNSDIAKTELNENLFDSRALFEEYKEDSLISLKREQFEESIHNFY